MLCSICGQIKNNKTKEWKIRLRQIKEFKKKIFFLKQLKHGSFILGIRILCNH